MTTITIPNSKSLFSNPVGTLSSQSFQQKLIDVAISLAQSGTNTPNTFSGTGSDQVSLSGSRTSVRIQFAGGLAGSGAQIAVYGLEQGLMNELSTLGMVIQQIPRNLITVTAGDEVSGMATVFSGVILNAYGDYNSAPDVPFRFDCQAGAASAVIPLPASSFTGATDVVTIMSSIAQKAGWGFQNNGVSGVMLANPYFTGSAVDQVKDCAEHARINWILLPGTQAGGGQAQVLSIFPLYGFVPGGGIPILAEGTGMIAYPSYTQQGIMVKTVFNPQIAFGTQINVQSSIFTSQSLGKLNNPSSIWTVNRIDHALDSLVPEGEWSSTIYAYNPSFPQPTLPPTG